MIYTRYTQDNIGFVRLVDHMGTDTAICDAARISYGNHEEIKTSKENRDLIRYLMRHNHTTPFEMCEIKFHVKVPMDTWRQWIRHRTANVNEYSTRYKPAIDDMKQTNVTEWRLQSKNNKQGSSGEYLNETDSYELSESEFIFHEIAKKTYKDRIEKGIALEQARKDLPLSTYTEAYWKCDLHNIFHFLRLRLDSHAQKEIREYAYLMSIFVKELFPIAWEAFEDYRLHAITLSRTDILCIKNKYITYESGSREYKEFTTKCEKLGLNFTFSSDIESD